MVSACCAARSRVSSSRSSPGRGAAEAISSTWWRRSSVRRASSCSSVSSSAAAATVARHARCASTTDATSGACPPKPSRRMSCRVGSRSRCWSCWPWISARRDPSDDSPPTVTARSLTRARERPSAPISRRTISVPSPAATTSAIGSASTTGGASKIASTRAASVPVLTWSVLARAPRARASASTTSDLPAPVSPVRTVKPFPRVNRTDSTTARFSTVSSRRGMGLRGT